VGGLDPTVYVHPKGLCESDRVGPRTRIWAFAHVLPGAEVGADCNVGDHALVAGNPARRIGGVCTRGRRIGERLGCSCGRGYRLVDERAGQAETSRAPGPAEAS
jgi:hypothetical protein